MKNYIEIRQFLKNGICLLYPKDIQRFCQKSQTDANSGACMLFVLLWRNAYKNPYVIHLLVRLNIIVFSCRREFCNALVLSLWPNISYFKSSQTKPWIRSIHITITIAALYYIYFNALYHLEATWYQTINQQFERNLLF